MPGTRHPMDPVMDWGWSSHTRMQKVVQSWYGRQVQRLHGEAEAIREGALQEVFALRRQLELLQMGASTVEEEGDRPPLTPEIADRLYDRLKELSDRLSPSFLEDSLPLALRTRLDAWQHRYPHIPIHLNLPSEWPPLPYEHSYLLLTILEDVLSLALTDLSATAIAVSLEAHPSQILDIAITVPDGNFDTEAAALEDVGLVFQWLLQGKYTLNWNHSTCQWRGVWPAAPLP